MFHPTILYIKNQTDELALLFTGLKAPASSHSHARQSVELECVDEDEDDTQQSPVTIIAGDGDAEDVYIHPDSGVSEGSVCSCDSNGTPAPSLVTPPPGGDRPNDPVGSGVLPSSITCTAKELERPTAQTHATSHIHPSLVPPPSSPPRQAQTLSQSATSLLTLLNCPPHPLFTTEKLGVDRRLIVNRKRQVKMYRVWMQGVFKKISMSIAKDVM